METSEKSDHERLAGEIRHAFTVMGYSERAGAGRLFDEMNPGLEDDHERRAFVYRFKKHLSRNTTPAEVLQRYLSYIQNFEEFRQSDLYYLKPTNGRVLPDELTSELHAISREVFLMTKKRGK